MKKYLRLFGAFLGSFYISNTITVFKSNESHSIVFTQLYNINNVPLNKETATAPAINNNIPFPFGKKSNDFMLEAVSKELIPIAIISQTPITDAPNINRVTLPTLSMTTLVGNKLSEFIDLIVKNQPQNSPLRKLKTKDFQIIPKVLFIKKEIIGLPIPSGVAGIELCFPKAEQTILGIERIGFILVQSITKETSDQTINVLGFNPVSFAHSENTSSNMLLLNTTQEQKTYVQGLVKDIFDALLKTHKSKFTAPLLKKVSDTVNTLSSLSIGIIIEQTSSLQKTLNQYDKDFGLNHYALKNDDYLFWNKNNKYADSLVHAIQKNNIPINTNYYIFGTVMGYTEEQIKLRYQLEGYLRATNEVYQDGSVAWPYNIPKWGIENGIKFNAWVKNTWSAKLYLLSSEKYKRKQYEADKKNAQKYKDFLPMSQEKAIDLLKDKPVLTQQDKPVLAQQEKQPIEQEVKPVNTLRKKVDQREIDTKIRTIEGMGNSADVKKDFDVLENTFKLYYKKYKKNEISSLDELHNDLILLLKNTRLKKAAFSYITNPIKEIENIELSVAPIRIETIITNAFKESGLSTSQINFIINNLQGQDYIDSYKELLETKNALESILRQGTITQKNQTETLKNLKHTFKVLLIGLISTEAIEKIQRDFNLI